MHTPGPWKYDADKTYMPNEVVRFNGCVLAVRGRDAMEQDMRLIAAAPDLLDALCGIVENEHRCTCDGPCDGKCWHAIARVAIDKARQS